MLGITEWKMSLGLKAPAGGRTELALAVRGQRLRPGQPAGGRRESRTQGQLSSWVHFP